MVIKEAPLARMRVLLSSGRRWEQVTEVTAYPPGVELPDRPLASMKQNTLKLDDGPDQLRFSFDVPKTTYLDATISCSTIDDKAGDFGVDPLYRIPPDDVVPGAVRIEPEPGNPDVEVEIIEQAVLTGLGDRGAGDRSGNPGTIARAAPAAPAQAADMAVTIDAASARPMRSAWICLPGGGDAATWGVATAMHDALPGRGGHRVTDALSNEAVHTECAG